MEKSRQELLGWINDLLQFNLTKIEQVGTGAVLCQIMDSIYGDVPLHKVKFNTHQEYEYIQNFKVLQSCFTKHGIDKFIPVDKLIKLKFQDNLEFLQWVNKFWEAHYQGSYDPIARRKSTPQSSGSAPIVPSSKPMVSKSVVSSSSVQRTPQKTTRPANTLSAARPLQTTNASSAQVEKLTQTITDLNLTVDTLEKERDFYFCKLREIETLVQNPEGLAKDGEALVKRIQEILYNTEEGFEVPATTENIADETF